MNITCKKCQALLEENAKYCSHCGWDQNVPVIKKAEENPDAGNVKSVCVHMEIPEEKRAYQFQKRKYIGSVKYSTITTCIYLEPSCMKILQEKKTLGFFTKKLLDLKIKYGDIHDIVMKKTMDTYELIFAIICCILGVVMPPAFLLALLLLWVGYGKKVHIFTTKNVYKIPTSAEFELNKMMAAIKAINPNIFIKR